MKGKIKWFSTQKGYGFILGDDEQDYFVHVSQIPVGQNLNEDMEVEFDIVQTEKGNQAHNVRL